MQRYMTRFVVSLSLLTLSIFGTRKNNIATDIALKAGVKALCTSTLQTRYVAALKGFHFKHARDYWSVLEERDTFEKHPDENFVKGLLDLAKELSQKLITCRRGGISWYLSKNVMKLCDQLNLVAQSLHALCKEGKFYYDGAYRFGGKVFYPSAAAVLTEDAEALKEFLNSTPYAIDDKTCRYAVRWSGLLGTIVLRYARQKDGRTYCNEYFVSGDRADDRPAVKKQKDQSHTMFEELCQRFVAKSPSAAMIEELRELLTDRQLRDVVLTKRCFVLGPNQKPTIPWVILNEFFCYGRTTKTPLPSLAALVFCHLITSASFATKNTADKCVLEKVIESDALMPSYLAHLIDSLSTPEVLRYFGKLIQQCDSQMKICAPGERERWLEYTRRVLEHVRSALDTMLSQNAAFFAPYISLNKLRLYRFEEWIFVGVLNHWFCWDAQTARLKVRKEEYASQPVDEQIAFAQVNSVGAQPSEAYSASSDESDGDAMHTDSENDGLD
jgi:hypothetical protein